MIESINQVTDSIILVFSQINYQILSIIAEIPHVYVLFLQI